MLVLYNMSNNQFVNNKELNNNRLFERNQLNAQLACKTNQTPMYLSDNHNKNRNEAINMFENRFLPELHQGSRANVGFVNFSKDNFNSKKDNNISKNNTISFDRSILDKHIKNSN